jgi:hypothetical protein
MNLEEDLTYHEVQHDLTWKLTMDDEMTSITKMKTWTLIPLPQGKKAITCRWIYKKKIGINGVVEHYKAILVTRGCEQKARVDFEETFSPIAKWNTIKAVSVLTSSKG